MPADHPDLPSLDRLTADVARAMRAAERAPRARWWRRTPPLAVTLLALAVPSAVALHATTGKGAERPVVPVPALHCDGGKTIGVAMLLTGGAATVGRCQPNAACPALSRRGGSRAAAPARRSCA